MDIQEYIQSGKLEQYALGTLSKEESASVLRALEEHPELRAELELIEDTLYSLGISHADTVPADFSVDLAAVKNAVIDSNSEHPISTSDSTIEKQGDVVPLRKMRGLQRFSGIAAAIAILGLAAAGYLFNQTNNLNAEIDELKVREQQLVDDFVEQQTSYNNLIASFETISDPETQKVLLASAKDGESFNATVYWKENTQDVYLYANNLPEAPEGKQYQLWTLVDGTPIDAGILPKDQLLAKLKNVAASDTFAITLENEGGAVAPNLDQLYVIGNVS